MRIIASIEKRESVRFVSHLDIQRMLHRAVRRADIPVAYSQGFNPHALISFATALSVGQTSENEWIDVKLAETMKAADFMQRMNDKLPDGFCINRAYAVADNFSSLTAYMQSAEYVVYCDDAPSFETISCAIDELLNGAVIIKKRKKSGGRRLVDAEVDIRPMIYSMSAEKVDERTIIHISGKLDALGGLNVDKLMTALDEKLAKTHSWRIHRKAIVLSDKAELDW